MARLNAAWWANLTTAGVVLIPLIVTLVNAIRARAEVVEVKELVNGHSSRLDSRIQDLERMLEESRRREHPGL